MTPVRIRMLNTGEIATAAVPTPQGRVRYDGEAAIAGVPGTAAPIPLTFEGVAGSTCGALLPTGRPCDEIDGLAVTLIDGGMPCVILRAADLGLTGYEEPRALEGNAALRARIEAIRLAAGPLMNLGDVAGSSVPKMVLAAPPVAGGAVHTRCFIPHRCHSAIGVFAAVGVATACLLPGAPVAALARPGSGPARLLAVEHPTGAAEVLLETDAQGTVVRAGTLRTARKLFDGHVFPAVR
jgi:4-oxalomesaconate tautomerase